LTFAFVLVEQHDLKGAGIRHRLRLARHDAIEVGLHARRGQPLALGGRLGAVGRDLGSMPICCQLAATA